MWRGESNVRRESGRTIPRSKWKVRQNRSKAKCKMPGEKPRMQPRKRTAAPRDLSGFQIRQTLKKNHRKFTVRRCLKQGGLNQLTLFLLRQMHASCVGVFVGMRCHRVNRKQCQDAHSEQTCTTRLSHENIRAGRRMTVGWVGPRV